MNTESLGKNIAALRREKGAKQEELAAYVGVTAQAVSKWENGGLPDAELLPAIADFFKVSIDTLYGRAPGEEGSLRTQLINEIINMKSEERFKKVFDICWDMERAMFPEFPRDGSIVDYEAVIGKYEQRYSTLMSDNGFTRMGIGNRLQYFLIVPECNDKQAALFGGVEGLPTFDYPQFFADFSDRTFFDAVVMLNKRENGKAFTAKLIEKNLGIDTEKAEAVIKKLKNYGMVHTTEIEMDDEIQTVYTFNPSPSFFALLIFAHEVMDPPNNFSYYSGGRNKPYLE